MHPAILKSSPCTSSSNAERQLSSSQIQVLLTDPKKKIRRPPNAFMLYARENRKLISEKNPDVNNKDISTMLGKLWRSLDSLTKAKYFDKAKIMDRLHKQKYPGYVYNPKEARLRKRFKEETKRRRKRSNESFKSEHPQGASKIEKENVRKSHGFQSNEMQMNAVKVEYCDESNDKNNDVGFNGEPLKKQADSSPEYRPNNPHMSFSQHTEAPEGYPLTPRNLTTVPSFGSSTPQGRMSTRSYDKPNNSWYASPEEQTCQVALPNNEMCCSSAARPLRCGFSPYAGSHEGPRYFPSGQESADWNSLPPNYDARYFMPPYGYPPPRLTPPMPSQLRFYRPQPAFARPTSTQSSRSTIMDPEFNSTSGPPAHGTYPEMSSDWTDKKNYQFFPRYPFWRPYPMHYTAYYHPDLDSYYGSMYGMEPTDVRGSYGKSFPWSVASDSLYRGVPLENPNRPYMDEDPPETANRAPLLGERENENQLSASPQLVVDEEDTGVNTNECASTVVVETSSSNSDSGFNGVISSSFDVLNYPADNSRGGEKNPAMQYHRKSPPKKSSMWRNNF